MKTLKTSLRAERGTTLHLLMTAGSLLCVASAHAQPRFDAIPMPAGVIELRPLGIGSTGQDGVEWIAYKAIREAGVQVYEAAGVWKAGLTFEAPNPVGPNGEIMDLVNVQFRSMPPREELARPGQTIPGIDIIVKKTPAGKAAYWDTRGSDTGILADLDDPFSAEASWPNSLNADGSVIVGAVFADLDGMGPGVGARHAARWLNFGSAELMPVPADSQYSEVWGTSGDGGTSVGCYKAITEKGWPSDPPKEKPTNGTKGIIWNSSYPDGYRVIDASAAGPDATGIAITGITDDAGIALAAISTTRSNSKGAKVAVSTGDVVVLDGGDINGDGVIDLLDDHDSSVNALSLDGSIVGGSLCLLPGEEQAAVWLRQPDGSYSHQSLALFLTSFGVTGMEDWTLSAVTGISPDGSALTGWGTNPQGLVSTWYVWAIPTPGAITLAGLAGLVASRRRR